MLQRQVVQACRQALAAGAARRQAVIGAAAWSAWQQMTLATVRRPFPPWLWDHPAPLAPRTVAVQQHRGFRLENVVFTSLPGWEVNASVYLPGDPGTYPAVVCPTGHSDKTGPSYQEPAQILARSGYIAVSFDPPGCSGELARLNDHFVNGVIGYLTGVWSQAHFVLDARRCLDYLQTRPDVDTGAGFAATGVSGGGITSLFLALVDDRVRCLALSCCLARHADLHLRDLYTSCPEQFGPGYLAAGLDYVDYVAALAPRPCLLLAGAHDEVFALRSTQAIAREAARLYAVAGAPGACRLHVDRHSGHAYTADMAQAAVRWFDRHLQRPPRPSSVPAGTDLVVLSREQLACRPCTDANMHTVNRAQAERLATARAACSPSETELRTAALSRLGLTSAAPVATLRAAGRAQRVWHARVGEVQVVLDTPRLALPGLLVRHYDDPGPRPGLLWLDETGRWAAFRQHGPLVPLLRAFEADCLPDQPVVLSLEVSGLGGLAPAPVAYDLAGWNDSARILTYLSFALGTPVMGLRVRDALAGLQVLANHPAVDRRRLAVGGRGVGALVALHVALIAPEVGRAVCWNMLSGYGQLAAQFPYAWPPSCFIPGVLLDYDLPELAAAVAPRCSVVAVDLVDGARQAAADLGGWAAVGGATVVGGGAAAVVSHLGAPWPGVATP
jgi:dienelactone hydrolase